MVEVFKTNIKFRNQAELLIGELQKGFPQYQSNFDLEDCDKILRIESDATDIDPNFIISLVNRFGFHAEVLPDDVPVDLLTCM